MIHKLIKKFGGINSMARKIGASPSAVNFWDKRNKIPRWWYLTISETAKKYKIDVSEFSFLKINNFYGIEERDNINNE